MFTETINQYDAVKLLEDLNPKIKKGMIGAILEKYSESDFEVEFLDKEEQILTMRINSLLLSIGVK